MNIFLLSDEGQNSEPLNFSAAAAADTSHATREATQNADHPPSGGALTLISPAWYASLNTTPMRHRRGSGKSTPLSRHTVHHEIPLDHVQAIPALLMDTIGTLCDTPAAVTNSYCELQNILLQS